MFRLGSSQELPNPFCTKLSEISFRSTIGHLNIPTGTSTILHSFRIMAPKGKRMLAPKKRRSKAGVRKTPAILLMTALHNAVATLPPDAFVKKMHMLIVVGRQLIMSNPSNKEGGNNFGTTRLNVCVNGRPTKSGQAPKVASWMALFSRKLDTASFSSDNSKERPDKRNTNVTPNFPIMSSGLKYPPLLPTDGNNRANETVRTIPRRKKFFW
mmetsp:Transcript_19798/g.46061  ORF Transcript_19798/g.46061 Transcript_19798/m.46061 type:complete len:212 (+) Transcript_19798:508-1143(+)